MAGNLNSGRYLIVAVPLILQVFNVGTPGAFLTNIVENTSPYYMLPFADDDEVIFTGTHHVSNVVQLYIYKFFETFRTIFQDQMTF